MAIETLGAVSTTALPRAGHKSLHAATMPVASLDARTRAEAFALFHHAYEGADSERFERDLRDKQLIILLREPDTRALKGFSTVLLRDVPATRRRRAGTMIFSGDTVIDREYWGQKQLQAAFTRLLLTIKLGRPHEPLYWFLISKGWRTYLLLANAFPRAVPRHDRPRGDESDLEGLLDALATERFGAEYDAASGVIRYATPHERVRPDLAPIAGNLLENPHIRFFATRNPNHAAGDELACLAEVRVVDIAGIVGRLATALVRRRLIGAHK